MASVPTGASYIQLYSDEDPKETNRWYLECKDAAVTYKDSKDRPWKFQAQSFKFADKVGASEFDLRDRFVADEADILSAASAASAADGKAVAEATRAIAAEAGVSASVNSEIARAGAAESVISTAVGTEKTRAEAAEAQIDTDIAALSAARVAALALAVAAAGVARQAIDDKVTNILGASPANLDTLSEIVSHINSLDLAQGNLVVSLTAEVAALRAEVDTLLNN